MKLDLEQPGLLDDVLAEAAPADFERVLLEGTLRAVRRRHRTRRLTRGLAVVGACAAIIAVVWNALWPFSSVKSVRPGLSIVSSQPLPPSMIVGTQPGSVVVVSSSAKTVVLVETGSIKDPFREINDEQLLALVGKRPAALVRHGTHEAELLFVNPEDTNGFPVQ